MSVDDRGTHQAAGGERAGVYRPQAGGRHRRGRAAASSAVALEPAAEESEPLFTIDLPLGVLERPRERPLGLTYEPGRARRSALTSPHEPVLRGVVEDLVDLSEPAPEAGPPIRSAAAVAEPLEAPEPSAVAEPPEAAGRTGMFKSFRRWWRNEAMARAAQKRAFATAEAIIRAQAVQEPTTVFEKAPTPASYAQAIRGVMSLTEERFQSLGLRSDRLQDELRAISRTMSELRATLFLGGFEGVGPAAATAIGTLEQRFDALLLGLSEELSRRANESDRRLAEQITLQSAELATLLESAVERIRAAIPEGFETVRAAIPKEMARVRDIIPAEFQRVRDSIPGEMERIRAEHRAELDRIRAAIPVGFEQIRSTIPTELAKILPDQIDRVRDANAEEFERIRAQIPDEVEKVRLTIPVEIERLRATIPEALGRVRGDVAELSVVLHEVIAQIAAITSAASGQGERAEPR